MRIPRWTEFAQAIIDEGMAAGMNIDPVRTKTLIEQRRVERFGKGTQS